MANKRIDQLPINSNMLKGTDSIPIWDVVNNKTERVELDTLASFIASATTSPIINEINNNLILEGTTTATTSQAIYGVNIITAATNSDLATRLPNPTTGRQTVFINNSSMSILVFPSVVGGEINGVVDGVASIPNDGNAYTFYCTQNPLPGAWSWSPPSVGQIQVPTIEVAHTYGVTTSAYGVGVIGAQLINPPGQYWFNNVNIAGSATLVFTPSQDYWATSNLTPERTLTVMKVYSNFLSTDSPSPSQVPQVQRYVSYGNGAGMNNYTSSGIGLYGGQTVQAGPSNSPSQIGDVGTLYKIQQQNLLQISPVETDSIGVGPFTNYYYTFIVVIPSTAISKTYKFDIFLEHT